jgi:DNA-binding GntR family transcriptional regulator
MLATEPLTAQRAVELRDIHLALEAIGAQRWSERADAEALEALASAFERVRELVDAGAGADLIRRAKDRFFGVLFRSTGSSVVPDSLRSIEPATRVVRHASIASPDRPRRMLDELEAILAAAGSRDRDALTAACRRHIDNEFSTGLTALLTSR